MSKRILYLQFTNPAAYPPLEHSGRILADRGWSVTFLGCRAFGAAGRLSMRRHPRMRTYRLPYFASPGLRKIAYGLYCAWATLAAIALRPRWIYASDPLSALPALLASWACGRPIVYHEHDSPSDGTFGSNSFITRDRTRIAAKARLCILPNEERAQRFRRDTGTHSEIVSVWNCPEATEAADRPETTRSPTILFYHGSINRERLPFSILQAMKGLPERIHLEFAGYATAGAPRYPDAFLAEATRLGLSNRVQYLGTTESRAELMERCRRASLGLSLIPLESDDPNLRMMAGASNKPYDYLACGLALLVSDLPQWRAMFCEPGYALAVDPASSTSIAQALRWFDEHADETAAMGRRGRRRIAEEWNYETQFAPVLRVIEAT